MRRKLTRAGAAILGAGLLLVMARPAAAQDSAAACPVAVDTVIDTLFVWVPRQLRDEPLARYEFRNVQERTALGMIDFILLGARNGQPGWRGPVPVGAEHLADAEVVVWFQLRGDGRVAGMKLERRSGWSALDVALQRAVLRADSLGSFDSLPRALQGQPIDLFLAAGRSRRRDAASTPVAGVASLRPRPSSRSCRP